MLKVLGQPQGVTNFYPSILVNFSHIFSYFLPIPWYPTQCPEHGRKSPHWSSAFPQALAPRRHADCGTDGLEREDLGRCFLGESQQEALFSFQESNGPVSPCCLPFIWGHGKCTKVSLASSSFTLSLPSWGQPDSASLTEAGNPTELL